MDERNETTELKLNATMTLNGPGTLDRHRGLAQARKADVDGPSHDG